MSNSTDTVSHNTYFDGKVQSLGLQTTDGKATVGVMKAGSYEFGTSNPEKMIIVAGNAEVSLDGETWNTYGPQGIFDVQANVKFQISCDADLAYICYYE